MDPASISAMSTVGASAASGIAGYFSTRYAANKSAEQAEKNRELALHLADKERKEALEDREHAEMYNSPLMERVRREAAGLGPVDDYSTPGTTAEGLVPNYAEAAAGSNDALVSAAQLGASAPSVLMRNALDAAKDLAQIHKDNSAAAEMSGSKAVLDENARFLKETFEDRALKVKLENDQIFTETSESIRRGALLLEQKNLTATQRHQVEIEVNILQRTQEYRVSLEKSRSEKAAFDVQISEKELNEMMPAQLRQIESSIAANYARAASDSANARRTNMLLPLEFSHLEKANAALDIAVKDSSLIHDENIVKHNVFMSHIAEYSDSIVARYKVDRQTADWYAVNQVVNTVAKAATTAVSVVGIGKMLTPVTNAANAVAKGSSLILPGSSPYENLARRSGLDTPGFVR